MTAIMIIIEPARLNLTSENLSVQRQILLPLRIRQVWQVYPLY